MAAESSDHDLSRASGQVGMHNPDPLVRRSRRRGMIVGINDAVTNMVLDDIGNEAIQGHATGGSLLQDGGAPRLLV
jgi:hypothetical protein